MGDATFEARCQLLKEQYEQNLVYLAPATKEAAKLLKEEAKINATVINPYYITGLDEALLIKLKQNHDTVITLEDGILDGGFGEKIARFYGASNMKVMNYGLKKEFLDRYNVDAVLKDNHLTLLLVIFTALAYIDGHNKRK